MESVENYFAQEKFDKEYPDSIDKEEEVINSNFNVPTSLYKYKRKTLVEKRKSIKMPNVITTSPL